MYLCCFCRSHNDTTSIYLGSYCKQAEFFGLLPQISHIFALHLELRRQVPNLWSKQRRHLVPPAEKKIRCFGSSSRKKNDLSAYPVTDRLLNDFLPKKIMAPAALVSTGVLQWQRLANKMAWCSFVVVNWIDDGFRWQWDWPWMTIIVKVEESPSHLT